MIYWRLTAVAAVAITLFAFESVATRQIPPARPALAESSRIVSVYFDGQQKIIATDSSTVGEALKRAGVQVAPGDLVEPAVATAIPNGFFNINVYRARPVVINDGTKVVHTISAHQSPRLVAQNAGLRLYPEDEFEVQIVNDFVGDGSLGERITIRRATPVILVADNQRREIRTQATTVQGVLEGQNVPLGVKDTVQPAGGTALTAGMVINVTRVSDVTVTLNETLAKKVRTVFDSTLLKGVEKVQAEGADGRRTVTYHINYRNGVEVARQTLKVENLVEPIERVVVVGTKVVFANNVEQWRDLTAKYFPGEVDYALAIMSCESKGNPFAVSPTNDHGLMQVNFDAHKAKVNYNVSSLYDPETNLRIAAQIKSSSGWGAWSCSRKI